MTNQYFITLLAAYSLCLVSSTIISGSGAPNPSPSPSGNSTIQPQTTTPAPSLPALPLLPPLAAQAPQQVTQVTPAQPAPPLPFLTTPVPTSQAAQAPQQATQAAPAQPASPLPFLTTPAPVSQTAQAPTQPLPSQPPLPQLTPLAPQAAQPVAPVTTSQQATPATPLKQLPPLPSLTPQTTLPPQPVTPLAATYPSAPALSIPSQAEVKPQVRKPKAPRKRRAPSEKQLAISSKDLEEAAIPLKDIKEEIIEPDKATSIFEKDEGEEEFSDIEETPQEQQKTSGRDPFFVIKKTDKLASLVERLAARRGFNVILPHGSELLKETLNLPKSLRMPLSEAEKYIHMLLELDGYSLRPSGAFFKVTKLNENNFATEPLKLYVDPKPNTLPKTDEHIKAIYFLSNFKVPQNNQGNEPINLLIKDLLGSQKVYFFDQKTNAVILIGSAQKIANTMEVVRKLDAIGSPEKLGVIPLFNTSAKIISELLNKQIIATASHATRPTIKTHEDLYFAPNTRVIPDISSNALIVLGQDTAINRIRDLIRDYLDVPLDTGHSVLHVYNLQYLNSKEFAPILSRIVTPGGSEQSRKDQGSTERLFDGVIIIPEEESEVRSAGSEKTKGSLTIGGNRLIIAANQEDWKQIKQLIEQLDKPVLQVIFEIYIMDLTHAASKRLSAQMRTPAAAWGLPHGVEGQFAGMETQLLDGSTPATATTLESDLLQLNTASTPTSMAGRAPAGSTIVSLRDPARDNIWSVFSSLDNWNEQHIVSQFFIVTMNNSTGIGESDEMRRKQGEASSGPSGVTTIPTVDYTAKIKIEITPRISSLNRLSFKTHIEIQDFLSSQDFTRSSRSIDTSAILSTGQILVMGGLTKINDTESQIGVPILSRIPIIGNLFKGSGKTKERSNLAIFIHPTIIDPKLRSGLNLYTSNKVTTTEDLIHSTELFSSLKDPITRFYFKDKQGEKSIDLFNKYYEHSKQISNENSDEFVISDTLGNEAESKHLKELFKNASNPFEGKQITPAV